MNSQSTSVPYSLDVLQPRDAGLLAAIEFGTNIAPGIGDFFDWSGTGPGDYSAAVEPRLGMLRCTNRVGVPVIEPRGQSFALPPPAQWGLVPGEPPTRACTVYAHTLLREGRGGSPPVEAHAGIILGTAAQLVGTPAPAAREGTTCSVFQTPWIGAAPTAIPAVVYRVDKWTAGVPSGGASVYFGPNGGGGVYWRIDIQFEPVMDRLDWTIYGTRTNDASWQLRGLGEFNGPYGGAAEPLRIGAYVAGSGVSCLLDWVRMYEAQTISNDDPNIAETGGRLFVV